MIILMLKEYKEGRWFNVNAERFYKVGDVVKLPNSPISYTVTNVNGCKVTLEVVE